MSEHIYQPPQTEDLIRQEELEVPTKLNPWKSIWTQPRKTIRFLVTHNPDYMVILLAIISGILNAINQASMEGKGDEHSLTAILGMSIVGGLFGGLIGLYLVSWLQSITGRWLGGIADSSQVRVAYAWSSVPAMLVIPILIIQIALFGNDIFTSSATNIYASEQNLVLFWGTVILESGFGLWGIVWHLIGLSEVHKFSIWKALATAVLSLLLIASPFILLGFFIAL